MFEQIVELWFTESESITIRAFFISTAWDTQIRSISFLAWMLATAERKVAYFDSNLCIEVYPQRMPLLYLSGIQGNLVARMR